MRKKIRTTNSKICFNLFTIMKIKALILFFNIFFCIATVSATTIDIQDTPMDTMAKSALPNIMFILDDSGSMDWEFMVAGISNGLHSNKYYVYPAASYVNDTSDNAYSDGNSLNSTQREEWRTRWSGYNLIFYNPNVTYIPWPGLSNASTSTPWSNPNNTSTNDSKLNMASSYVTASGVDIKTAHYFIINDLNGDGDRDNGEDIYLVNFVNGARVYYLFNDANSDNDIDAGELTSKTYAQTPDGVKAGIYDDEKNFLSYATDVEDLQNFANWFSYYHKRELIAKAAVARSIVQMETGNVGLYSIHNRVNMPVVLIPANQGTLLTELYTLNSSGGTPLRKALQDVGQYYDQDDNNTGNIGSSPYASAEDGGICQQAFAIAMTDGFWNGDSPGVGNEDASEADSLWDGAPFADNTSDTLADVAMKYFEEDLADNLEDLLPTTACEQLDSSDCTVTTTEDCKANHQHMVTYTVSFGQTGTLIPDNYHDCMYHEKNPPAWTSSKIDDLYHAAVNGRGLFFSASNAQELVKSLAELTSDIAGRTASGSSVAVSSEELQTGSMVYQATFESENWTGSVKAYAISPESGVISSTPEWNAALKLEQTGFEWFNRNIISYKPKEGVIDGHAIDFLWSNLSAAQKTLLKNDENILKFIRGKLDIAGFRARSQKLGDIVHSAPTLQGNTLFAGGNDGMLHAFDIANGEERFAYIPNLVMDNFYDASDAKKDFTDPTYSHLFFIDGVPTIQDYVDPENEPVSGDGDDEKYTYLVGGLAKGGKGYYCLNITDADTMTKDSDISNIKSMLLWEYPKTDSTAAEKNNMGYSFSQASIVRSNLPSTEGPIGDKKRKWVIIFGNGYNSTNGNSVLYVLDLEGNLLKMIDTGITGGLSTPNVIDVNDDIRADYVYAGDLAGNLWKFNISSADIADWDVAHNDGSNSAPNYGKVPLLKVPGRAITTQPDIMRACNPYHKKCADEQNQCNSICTTAFETCQTDKEALCESVYIACTDLPADCEAAYNACKTIALSDCTTLFDSCNQVCTNNYDLCSPVYNCPIEDNSHGYMIFFGTGKYFHKDDMSTTDEQYIFGVWDYGDDSDKKEYLGVFNPVNGTVTNTARSKTYSLLEQKIEHAGVYFGRTIRVMTDNPIILETTCDNKQDTDPSTWENPDPTSTSHVGWFFRLSNSNPNDYTGAKAGYPNDGERSIKDVFVRDGKLIYLTFTPSTEPCSGGGNSMLHEVDACSGGSLEEAQLDLNDDGVINEDDRVNIGTTTDPIMLIPSGWQIAGLAHNPAIIRKPGGKIEFKIIVSSSGAKVTIPEKQKQMGIFYWYEY